jgi:hypothetical protein
MFKIGLWARPEDVKKVSVYLHEFFKIKSEAGPPDQKGERVWRYYDLEFLPPEWVDWTCPLCNEVLADVDKVAHLMLEHSAAKKTQSTALLLASDKEASKIEQLGTIVRQLAQFNEQEPRPGALYEGVRGLIRHAQKAVLEAIELYAEGK